MAEKLEKEFGDVGTVLLPRGEGRRLCLQHPETEYFDEEGLKPDKLFTVRLPFSDGMTRPVFQILTTSERDVYARLAERYGICREQARRTFQVNQYQLASPEEQAAVMKTVMKYYPPRTFRRMVRIKDADVVRALAEQAGVRLPTLTDILGNIRMKVSTFP
ncbi:MAG: hypothetical protein M1368_12870 [Thaumarchaeota archaeon]|nr:hypothetical protein [Nitrososphaerota archaeon]